MFYPLFGIILFVGICLFSSICCVQVVAGSIGKNVQAENIVIHVAQDGSGDFTTIQAAIDSDVNGDIVLISDGTYTGAGREILILKEKQ